MKKIAFAIVVFTFLFGIAASADEYALTRLEAVDVISQILVPGEGGEPFDDTDDKTASYFRRLGIVLGMDGNNFMPDAPVKKQDFLIMLKKALDRACPNMFYNNQNVRWYYDQNSVSEYAQSYVRFLSAIDVYDEDGLLEPLDGVQRDEAQTFVDMAQRAKDNAVKSSNGQMYAKKPPILMYHVIGYPYNENRYLFVTPQDFEQQIKYMYDNGYTFLFPEELSLASRVSNPVVLTFDDGYEDTYTNAYKILKKYNAKATLYIFSDAIGQSGYCNAQQLREMSDSGTFRIYSHSKTHTDLSCKGAREIEAEFSESNDTICAITGREVTSVAYPFGFYSDDVLWQAKRYYKTGFSSNRGKNSIYTITRRTVDGGFSFGQFLNLIR